MHIAMCNYAEGAWGTLEGRWRSAEGVCPIEGDIYPCSSMSGDLLPDAVQEDPCASLDVSLDPSSEVDWTKVSSICTYWTECLTLRFNQDVCRRYDGFMREYICYKCLPRLRGSLDKSNLFLITILYKQHSTSWNRRLFHLRAIGCASRLVDGSVKGLCRVDHVRRHRCEGRDRSCQG
ncbi:hypothetical protein EDD22DRAFT_200814 [Suillus occidentalis]|nr:hypothetical protein EDD22DRAFT_200814 [Suillus occidentalis]